MTGQNDNFINNKLHQLTACISQTLRGASVLFKGVFTHTDADQRPTIEQKKGSAKSGSVISLWSKRHTTGRASCFHDDWQNREKEFCIIYLCCSFAFNLPEPWRLKTPTSCYLKPGGWCGPGLTPHTEQNQNQRTRLPMLCFGRNIRPKIYQCRSKSCLWETKLHQKMTTVTQLVYNTRVLRYLICGLALDSFQHSSPKKN